MQIPNHHLLHQ